MSPAFTNKLLYTTQTKLPEQFLDEIKIHIENDTLFHSAINQDEINKKYRSSRNGWIHYDNWIGGIVFGMMMSANKEYFHYDVEYLDAPIQSTIYEKGDHYDWHSDVAEPKDHFKGIYQTERKLSTSLLINDDYEGGEIELKFGQFNEVLKPEAGSAIIFPSWMPHRVLPVTKGKRISLVAWMYGAAWK